MPEETPGNFYVFEGMDGVGKSTVAQRFADQIDAAYLETPGAGVQEIREYVDSPMHDRQTKFLMYFASNSAITDQVEPQLETGNDIVLDRYVPTTVLYKTKQQKNKTWENGENSSKNSNSSNPTTSSTFGQMKKHGKRECIVKTK